MDEGRLALLHKVKWEEVAEESGRGGLRRWKERWKNEGKWMYEEMMTRLFY